MSIARLMHGGVMLSILVFSVAGFADDPEEESDVWTQIFLKAAKSYELSDEKGEALKLRTEPVLNWSNPERNTTAGAVFLWTRDGQPAAVMCVYPSSKTTLDHEFQSLSASTLQATLNDRAVWKPSEAGVEYKAFSDVPQPGNARALRLTQMRALARTFSARIVQSERVPKPLRLLPTPIYRYPESEANREVVDGAIFGFVQGTDPEVLLLIEAVRNDKGTLEWRNALARMSIVPLEVKHNDEVVWKCESLWNRGSPQDGYHTIQNIPLEKPGSSQ